MKVKGPPGDVKGFPKRGVIGDGEKKPGWVAM